VRNSVGPKTVRRETICYGEVAAVHIGFQGDTFYVLNLILEIDQLILSSLFYEILW
jgi:hypothetical protein